MATAPMSDKQLDDVQREIYQQQSWRAGERVPTPAGQMLQQCLGEIKMLREEKKLLKEDNERLQGLYDTQI